MITTLRFALAAPLALALAACGGAGDGAEGTGELKGEPIAAVSAPEGQQWRDIAVETADGGTLVGNPDAPLKLIEYGSLTCPACAAFSANGSEALMEYVDTGRVSFELRQFAIHGPVDLMLGRLTKCGPVESVVPLSDQVWQNFDAVMEPIRTGSGQLEQAMQLPLDQRFVAGAEATGLIDFFAARGISADQARTCLADTAALEKAGVSGFTVLPVLGGSGRSGRWSRDGQVGRAGMVAVICLIRPERLDGLLDAAFAVVERHIGVVSVTDTEVLWAERF